MPQTDRRPQTFDRRGIPPAIVAPRRIQRSRRAGAITPHGAIYVGRPTMWGSPFERRPGIGHARGVILFGAWLADDLNPYILSRAGFGDDEMEALTRLRERLRMRTHYLRAAHLECWCPISSAWCHADVLLRVANR